MPSGQQHPHRPISINVKRDADAVGIPLPTYATDGAAGLDLRACEAVRIQPGEVAAVRTGLYLEIPPGFEGQVRPRSGLALHHGITILNAPGTIDSDYRGEIRVILIHHGQEPFDIERGDRIAQIVFAPVTRVEMHETSELSETERAAGGFGSSGSK